MNGYGQFYQSIESQVTYISTVSKQVDKSENCKKLNKNFIFHSNQKLLSSQKIETGVYLSKKKLWDNIFS